MAVDPDVTAITDALEARIVALEAAPEVGGAVLEFNAALATRLASLTPAEQVALLNALALNAKNATITPA